MSLVLPPLFHWSRSSSRASIIRRGLRPTTMTAVWVRPDRPVPVPRHAVVDVEAESLLAVCLGTSPSTAWNLSGRISAEKGEAWDLWEVQLGPDDEVHFRPVYGDDLDEVRVVNRIPKSRCWLVAQRTVPTTRR
ncbi:MAG: hypothetical protein JWN67_5035 [Actinomycetia bacterium]|nr:hypothetical protein [Actinomycetes bacterium]